MPRVARYRKALDKGLPPDGGRAGARQLRGVQRNHDEVKRLRDSVNTAAA